MTARPDVRLQRRPGPAPCKTGRGGRDLTCNLYRACLAHAASQEWPGFSCAGCYASAPDLISVQALARVREELMDELGAAVASGAQADELAEIPAASAELVAAVAAIPACPTCAEPWAPQVTALCVCHGHDDDAIEPLWRVRLWDLASAGWRLASAALAKLRPACSVTGCARPAKQGLCPFHLRKQLEVDKKAAGALCLIPDCDRAATVGGRCHSHATLRRRAEKHA